MDAQKQQAYRERAKWLKVVVDSFTPQERENLQKLSADERAKILLDRKAQLIAEGKLQPATQPSTQPAE
jgi:orotidine-5'-phosphate decarboxylase